MDVPSVQYVTARDGFRIAYAVTGSGRSFVLMPKPFTHIQLYWSQDTYVLPWNQGLADRFEFVQYDGRGQGMSGRGLGERHSIQDHLLDLNAVVERLRLDQFVLMAVNWFSHAAVQYAIENPDRVEGLVLVSCRAEGPTWPLAIYDTLADQDWDAYLRTQSALGESLDVSQAIQRLKQTVTREDWLVMVRAAAESDITQLLPELKTPTLVLHPSDLVVLPIEDSMKLTASIPNARMALIKGSTALGDAQGLSAIDAFLSDITPATSPNWAAGNGNLPTSLSERELEVLRLLAEGKSNQEIADLLVISRNTVLRHVNHIFDKTGAKNRVEAAAYAHRNHLLSLVK